MRGRILTSPDFTPILFILDPLCIAVEFWSKLLYEICLLAFPSRLAIGCHFVKWEYTQLTFAAIINVFTNI